MERKYKVEHWKDDMYEVVEIVTIYDEEFPCYHKEPNKIEENKVFKGTLTDCKAYIDLHEGGYMM